MWELVQGRVTIIIPCYNGKKYIKQCFLAVLKQTYKNIELIFVDDGSVDDSLSEAKKWKQVFLDEGMELICLSKENGGAASAINYALSKLTGEYFEVLDVDDYIYPKNIEVKVQYLKENTEIMFVRNDGEIFNVSNNKVLSHFCVREDEKRTYDIFDELLYGKTYNWTGTYLIRTDAFINVNKGTEIYCSKYGQNMQLLLPMAYYYECGFVEEVLSRYNEYSNSISHDSRYNRNIELLNGYEDIRVNVLNRLNLTNEKQLEDIQQFYLRQKMALAAVFKEKEAVKLFYKQLLHKRWKDKIVYLRVMYPIIDVCFRKAIHVLKIE